MFTAEDRQFLKDNFATKDDLKSFATKDDLKSFATKDDLKSFATKDDLKPLATKKDLKPLATKKALSRVEKKIDELSDYVIPALGNIFKWTDDIHKVFTGKSPKPYPEN